jgi:hypothetical protein
LTTLWWSCGVPLANSSLAPRNPPIAESMAYWFANFPLAPCDRPLAEPIAFSLAEPNAGSPALAALDPREMPGVPGPAGSVAPA